MSPVIIRLNWAKEEDMTRALRDRISELPPQRGGMWEAVSISALRDEVVVLVTLQAIPA